MMSEGNGFDEPDEPPRRDPPTRHWAQTVQRDESAFRIAKLAEEAAERALEKALPRLLETLGINATDQEERRDFRKDLEFMREQRTGRDDRKKAASNKFVSATVGFVVATAGGVVTWFFTQIWPHK
jgi:hypothetical protein